MQKTALEHDLQKLVEKALALGASGAKTVDVASIRTGAWRNWGHTSTTSPSTR